MTTLVDSQKPRQLAGANDSAGGQYKTKEALDSGYVLPPEDSSHSDDAVVELTTDQLLKFTRAAVRSQAFRKGVRFEGEDDMVQETLASVLQNKKNNQTIILTRPYVRVVAAGVVAHAARGRLRAEDRRAIGIFTADVTAMETELGRNLTGVEKDQLAAGIRDNWTDAQGRPNPRHRPSVDFVALAQVRVLSLDASASGADDSGNARTLADSISDNSAFSTDMNADDLSVDPDSAAGQVLSGVRSSKVQNRADAWDIYAGMTNLPTAAAGQVSPRQATAARVAIAEVGGPASAARVWLSGETDASTAALFAPFGHLGDGGRDDIAEALVGREAYAEELWNSALSTSSRRAR